MKDFFTELINGIIENKLNIEKTIKLRDELCRKYKPSKTPSLIEILITTDKKQREKLLKILKVKPSRTISGVAPIAIMSKPFPCPHVKAGIGPCIMCPGGLNSVFGNVPQSYTGKEPATKRAIRNKYDPYLQVFNRLEHYTLLNQDFSKVELIVMGGTFPSFSKLYQEKFITYALKAMNDFSALFFKNNKFDFEKFKEIFRLEKHRDDKDRIKQIQKTLFKLKGKTNLQKEQKRNENSKVRCIAMCLETRPDYSKEKQIDEMLRLGTTRVEIGVQTIYDEILKKINRGHIVADTIKATQLLKDSFLKCCYHWMPGLPFANAKKDLAAFKEIFSNQNFRPDALKIYPCMVVKGTKLFELWKNKKFKPLTTKDAIKLIVKMKRSVPEYCRIMRVQRDISSRVIEAGVDKTNLRQYISRKNVKCRCIRCREPRGRKIDFSNVKILRRNYKSSNGQEVFLSVEDVKNNVLLGFLRLRKPFKPFRKEITENSVGIRELHVYGTATPIGEKGEIQHKGFGKALLLEAERIAKEEFDAKKILVISGIGVKNYFFAQGYKRDGPYVSKRL